MFSSAGHKSLPLMVLLSCNAMHAFLYSFIYRRTHGLFVTKRTNYVELQLCRACAHQRRLRYTSLNQPEMDLVRLLFFSKC